MVGGRGRSERAPLQGGPCAPNAPPRAHGRGRAGWGPAGVVSGVPGSPESKLRAGPIALCRGSAGTQSGSGCCKTLQPGPVEHSGARVRLRGHRRLASPRLARGICLSLRGAPRNRIAPPPFQAAPTRGLDQGLGRRLLFPTLHYSGVSHPPSPQTRLSQNWFPLAPLYWLEASPLPLCCFWAHPGTHWPPWIFPPDSGRVGSGQVLGGSG